MAQDQTRIRIETSERGLLDITRNIRRATRGSGVYDGICHVFSKVSEATLFVGPESEAAVRAELFERLTGEHPGGVLAARALLVQPSIQVPLTDSKLALGPEQAIWLWEHEGPAERRLTVSTQGARDS